MSLLHSLAYSAIWHTEWKIGPISEASIGNVMLHASPGFITLANVMAFHLPWRRDNRLGLRGEDFLLRKELVAEYKNGGEKPFQFVRPPN